MLGRNLLVLVTCLTPFACSFSQILDNNEAEKTLYQSHVKSLDEFIERMNGKEIYPLTVEGDTNKIRTTRFTLFDWQLLKDMEKNDTLPSIYEEFVDDLERDSIEIDIVDPLNWIEAKCDFKWNDELKSLTLKMQLEEDSTHCWRWVLVGIGGLEESGLIDDKDVLRISPVEHEINFMGLGSLFNYDYKRISSTRKNGSKNDLLSYFFGLIFSGQLKYIGCRGVEFHCTQVPNYYFIVKEINRLTMPNSGWLIVSLTKQ